MGSDTRRFGTAGDGTAITAVRLGSGDLSVTVLTWGAALQDVRLAGIGRSLTLGGADAAAYAGPMAYFGTVVGPVANRLSGARATIAGRLHRFPANEGPNLLHGGARGTQARGWHLAEAGPDHARLTLDLADGDDGFPGNRRLAAAYRVEGAGLTLTLSAETDAPTLVNLANHSYWNLDGAPTTDGHRLTVRADHVLPVDGAGLPTGERRAVSGDFDLRGGHRLRGDEGFDHCFCLAGAPRPLAEAARLEGRSGVTLILETTEPGLQVYGGRAIATAPFAGHGGAPYGPRAGLALEAQGWPDAPNRPDFPPVLVNPGTALHQVTRWRFLRPA